jgi:hypothetical protein
MTSSTCNGPIPPPVQAPPATGFEEVTQRFFDQRFDLEGLCAHAGEQAVLVGQRALDALA